MSFNFEKAELIYKKRIAEIKSYYPELKKCKNNSIYNMWTKYSLSIYMK